MAAFRIREAHQSDFIGIAKVRVDTWRVAYKGIVPDGFLDGLSYQNIAERWSEIFWERKALALPFLWPKMDRRTLSVLRSAVQSKVKTLSTVVKFTYSMCFPSINGKVSGTHLSLRAFDIWNSSYRSTRC